MATTEATLDLVRKTENTFHWADYLVFGAFIVSSLAIGVYYGLFQKKKNETAKDFLMGGKDMQVLPVTLSIMSSFLSAILILGTPAEVYTQGTMYWMYLFGMSGAVILATLFFVPLLYRLKLTSSYEYLERRYNSSLAKLTGTLILFATQVLYLGIAMYSPSTALEAVTGFPEWATIILGGLVAMFYTAVGGMKASVWASAFQTLIMAAGVIAVIIKGCIDVGGVEKMWELNQRGQRVEFFDFNPDPFERHTFWTLIVGGTIGWLSTYGVNQASVQRYCAMPTLNKGRAVVLLNIPGLLFFMTITALSGMVIYAYYASVGCDPLEAGYISNSNQLMPYFVLDRLSIPGIPGLFLASLFGGALSSVSASLSALSAVTWQDLMVPYEPFKSMSVASQTITTKLLVVIYGGVGIGMAFMSANLGGTVLQASLSFTGASGGPLLGLFVLGAFFPCANYLGAIIGGIIGLAIPLWISIGAYTMTVASTSLSTTTAMCFVNVTVNATAPVIPEPTGLDRLYLISYLYYPAIGMSLVVVIGLFITMVTDCLDPRDVPNKYLIPFFDRMCCCLPEKTLWILRCMKNFKIDDEGEEVKMGITTNGVQHSSPYSASNGVHEKVQGQEGLPLEPIIHAYDNPALTSDNPSQPTNGHADGNTHAGYVPYHSRDYQPLTNSKTGRESFPPPEEPIYDEPSVVPNDEPLPPPPEEVTRVLPPPPEEVTRALPQSPEEVTETAEEESTYF